MQVAAALPGGDPLAAALAAGETPSPEMVAAAPLEGALKPSIAIGLLTAFVLLLGLSCWLTKYGFVYRLAPLTQSPEVLRAHARDVMAKLGYPDAPTDSADGVVLKDDYLRYIAEHDQSANRWDKLRTQSPGPYRFWYRQSPRYFVTSDQISVDNPALDVSGMTSVYLDMDGHLHWFVHVPPQRGAAAPNPGAPDWSIAFREAGLDVANFQTVASSWIPLHAYDTRIAWDGADPLHPESKIHVEAASFEGKLIYFETVYPWDQPARQELPPQSSSQNVFIFSVIAVFLIVLIGSALLVRRNLKLGRGDLSGATRLAFIYFIARMLNWLFVEHHNGYLSTEFATFFVQLSSSVFTAFFLWALYVGLEPFVRRRWPQRIISWSRLLRGHFRDPLVGRDILIGAVVGGLIMFSSDLTMPILRWLGRPFELVKNPGSEIIGALFWGRFASQLTAALFLSFIALFLLLLFVVILRRELPALALLWILMMMFGSLVGEQALTSLPAAALSAALTLFVLYRHGFLALCSSMFFAHLWVFYPMTTELRAWYAIDFVIAAVICLALASYACYTSMAGQRMFGGKFLED